MTEGQPKGEESLLFKTPKTLLGTFGIFEYCSSSLPCLEPGYCAYRGGSWPGAAASHPIIDTDVWKCVLCARVEQYVVLRQTE